MKAYPKIDTLFDRDENFKVQTDVFKNKYINMLKDIDWVCTEKIDGTNTRIIWNGDGSYEIKGRGDTANIDKRLLVNLTKMMENRIHLFKEVFGEKAVCLYGEGYGGRIQGNKFKYQSQEKFICFDILIGDKYVDFDTLTNLCNKLQIEIVPVIENVKKMNDIVEYVRGGFKSAISVEGKNAEGIVARPKFSLYVNNGDRIIIKIKTKDFRK